MTITIKIETDNAAFQDGNREDEVSRILKAVDWYRAINGRFMTLHDYNGNTVGSVTVKGK